MTIIHPHIILFRVMTHIVAPSYTVLACLKVNNAIGVALVPDLPSPFVSLRLTVFILIERFIKKIITILPFA